MKTRVENIISCLFSPSVDPHLFSPLLRGRFAGFVSPRGKEGKKKRRKREEKGGDNGNLKQRMNLFEGAEFSFNTLTVHIRVIYSADLRTIFEDIWKDVPQECY